MTFLPSTSPGLSLDASGVSPRAWRLSLPASIYAACASIGVALVLFWSVDAALLTEAASGIQTIGRDTAPSVVAAQAIRADLADLEANAANAALSHGQLAVDAWRAFDKDQADLAEHLISAAQNITFGDAERGPIVLIGTKVQAYEGLIGRARGILSSPNTAPEQQADAALDLIRQSQTIMHQALLPAADDLNAANETVLDKTWARRKTTFVADSLASLAAALPALVLLLLLQWFLRARTRRLINPALVVATGLMLLGTIYTGYALEASAIALTHAKQDAFDSIRALWKARSIAYAANADESFFLLDPARQDSSSRRFFDEIGQLSTRDFTQAKPRAALLAMVSAFAGNRCEGAPPSASAGGFLGTELANVTFPGECEAATELFGRLAAYVGIDGEIRDLEAGGRHTSAVDLCVGSQPNQSHHAFALFDVELGRAIDINRRSFDDFIAEADRHLAGLHWIVALSSLLAGLATGLGVRPILDEYRS